MAKSINDMLENVLGKKPEKDNNEKEICAVIKTKKGDYKACLEWEKVK